MFRAIALIALLAVSAARSAADDWPMLARDAARSGTTRDEVRPPFARKWYRVFADEGLMSGVQPVIAGGRVYIGTLRGTVHAIDASTGADVWVFRAGGPVLHACAVDARHVYFGAADGKVYAVRCAEGALAWTVTTGRALWSAPAISAGRVYIGGRDGRMYCIDCESGRVVWSADAGAPILHSPAVDAARARVYAGAEDMRVRAFDISDGRIVWTGDKLPGVSFRGYHPVIAPDGSVMVAVTPFVCGETIQQIMMDMVKEVFGDMDSWRHKDQAVKKRIREQNFELLKNPETYRRQIDYLRKRLADQPQFQTLFVLDPQTGRQKFVAPVVYAESMNGPASPPLVMPDGRIIVKYSALLRARYGHYSPFLNVGWLDTSTGHITPVMDESRTYGWYDSLLLVHDEQSQLSAGGNVLFNTHQDNVNALDLQTLKGYEQPMCHGVHEVRPGTAAAIWQVYLSGQDLPMGWEWLARGTAVYGGGSVIDVPIAIAGDSFYFLPTHEISAGVVLLAYRMDRNGDAGKRAPEPSQKLSPENWARIKTLKWDWDTLEMPRLSHALAGLPEPPAGTRRAPLTDQAKAAVAAIADAQLDEIIFTEPGFNTAARADALREQLAAAVSELVSSSWRPLEFPAGKHPTEAYRFFVDPTETLYTLALAWPHLPQDVQRKVRQRVDDLSRGGGALGGPVGAAAYDATAGQTRTWYDPPPAQLARMHNDLVRTGAARLYPLWLWAKVTGDNTRLLRDWPALRDIALRDGGAEEHADCGNSRLAGLIAACRIARLARDEESAAKLAAMTRSAMRKRLEYELAHTEGGLMVQVPTARTIFGRWRFLTPDVAKLLAKYAGPVHQRLMDVYVDHHRPTWWLAWNVELLWRNESNFIFPTAPLEVFSARALILGERGSDLARYLDIPWCRADEFHIQKLALTLAAPE